MMHSVGTSVGPLLVSGMVAISQVRVPRKRVVIVRLLLGTPAVHLDLSNCGSDRRNRCLHLLVLSGSACAARCNLADSDLDRAIDRFPSADNIIVVLRMLFLAATANALQRQGMRSLCRAMRCRGSKMSFCRNHALLCFDWGTGGCYFICENGHTAAIGPRRAAGEAKRRWLQSNRCSEIFETEKTRTEYNKFCVTKPTACP